MAKTRKTTKVASDDAKKLDVAGISIANIRIKLVGTSSLICHKFSDRAIDAILAKQLKTAKKATGREAKNPERDFKESLYTMKDGRYGFPIAGFKNSAVDACRFMEGLKMTMARGAFFIIDESEGEGLAPIKGTPQSRRDYVRLGGMGSPADVRFRGEFPKGWEVNLAIRYNVNAISADQLVQLFNAAGFGVGVGDWRPQCNGPHGCFEVRN